MKSVEKIIYLYIFLYLILVTTNVYSYTRSTSEENPNIYLFWDSIAFPIDYYISNEGCYDIEDSSDLYAIWSSFNIWEKSGCKDVSFNYIGSSLDKPGFDIESRYNTNLIYFYEDDWNSAYDNASLAITTCSYYQHNGQILDCDIEVNDKKFLFGTNYESFKYDLQSVITHELGHFLGLDHSDKGYEDYSPYFIENNFTDIWPDYKVWMEATMFSHADKGETKKRILQPDDINGLCEIYSDLDLSKHSLQDSSDLSNNNQGCSCSLLP